MLRKYFKEKINFTIHPPVSFEWYNLFYNTSGWSIDFDVPLYSHPQKVNLQRPYVWGADQQKELIISILKGIQLPPVALIRSGRDSGTYLVIDGKQRLLTLINYLDDAFAINVDGKDYYWSDLHAYDKSEIKNCLNAYIVYDWDGTISDKDKVEWFKLINFSGTAQDKEHMKTIEL